MWMLEIYANLRRLVFSFPLPYQWRRNAPKYQYIW